MQPDPARKTVASNIPTLKFSAGITKENCTYDRVITKQADVNLLVYPLTITSNEIAVRKDLTNYESRYSPEGPAIG